MVIKVNREKLIETVTNPENMAKACLYMRDSLRTKLEEKQKERNEQRKVVFENKD